ncbi:MAG: STAS domain-containing protein [Clostridia bacterium]|nr:STAS domain-containing protein [Clostridia bacterium]
MFKRTVCDNFIDVVDDKGNVAFTIKEELTDDTLIVGLAGSVQSEAVYEFEDEILAALSICNNTVCSNPVCNRTSFKNLEFDLSRVTYISSVALRSFLKFQSIIDGHDGFSMFVVNPSPSVVERLNETGYADILDIRKTRPDKEG